MPDLPISSDGRKGGLRCWSVRPPKRQTRLSDSEWAINGLLAKGYKNACRSPPRARMFYILCQIESYWISRRWLSFGFIVFVMKWKMVLSVSLMALWKRFCQRTVSCHETQSLSAHVDQQGPVSQKHCVLWACKVPLINISQFSDLLLKPSSPTNVHATHSVHSWSMFVKHVKCIVKNRRTCMNKSLLGNWT